MRRQCKPRETGAGEGCGAVRSLALPARWGVSNMKRPLAGARGLLLEWAWSRLRREHPHSSASRTPPPPVGEKGETGDPSLALGASGSRGRRRRRGRRRWGCFAVSSRRASSAAGSGVPKARTKSRVGVSRWMVSRLMGEGRGWVCEYRRPLTDEPSARAEGPGGVLASRPLCWRKGLVDLSGAVNAGCWLRPLRAPGARVRRGDEGPRRR